jgi:hypothetical protein
MIHHRARTIPIGTRNVKREPFLATTHIDG